MIKPIKHLTLSLLCFLFIFSTFPACSGFHCYDNCGCAIIINPASGEHVTIKYENTTNDLLIYSVTPNYDIHNLEITFTIETTKNKQVAEWKYYISPTVKKNTTYKLGIDKGFVLSYFNNPEVVEVVKYSITGGSVIF